MMMIRIHTRLLLLLIRLLTFVLIFTLVVTILVGSVRNTLHIYIQKLQFSHLNVARGLYDALANNAALMSSSGDPYSPGFTTSEIQVLVDYALAEFDASPQFVVSAIWGYCFGTFDSMGLSGDNLDSPVTDIHSDFRLLECKTFPDYYFNYRAILGQLGLTIVLEYAYDGDYLLDARYTSLMNQTRSITKIFPTCMEFVGAAQMAMCTFALAMYIIRKRGSNQLANVLEQINALLSLGCLVAILVAVLGITIVLSSLKSSVRSELGAFGITLHLGRVFFTIMWVLFVTSFFNFCVWGGVTWCTVPPPENDEELYPDSRRHQRAESFANMLRELPYIGEKPSDVNDELRNDLIFAGRTFSLRRTDTPLTATVYPRNRGEYPQLQVSPDSDLISMVSVTDAYGNVDYNHILEANGTTGGAYSGFGLRKNGTIKQKKESDIEDFFREETYGWREDTSLTRARRTDS